LQEIAAPGGACLASRVHDDVRDRLDTTFADGGVQTLKNIARPVQVWRWSPGTQVPTAQAIGATADVPLALPDKPSIAVLPFQNLSGVRNKIISLMAWSRTSSRRCRASNPFS
jgi:adenylate cyclase